MIQTNGAYKISLQEELTLFASIINSSDDAIISKSLDGTIQSWNKGAERIFGYKAEEITGKNISLLIPPDRREEEAYIISKIKRGECIDHYESVRRKKDGTAVHMSISVSPMKDKNGNVIGAAKIARDITRDKKAEHEAKEKALYIEKRTSELYEALLKYTLLDFSAELSISKKGDEWDAIAIGLNTLRDELLSHMEQLHSVNKELEAFSYSVSHDLRAPLRSIDGYANMLMEDHFGKLDVEGKRFLNVIQSSAKKMGNLIDDLLAFSRLGRKEVQKTSVNMKAVAENATAELNHVKHFSTKIFIGDLHSAPADYALICHVFENLISNGIKYSSKKDDPKVEIISEKNNSEIIYTVKDNGAGFDMQYAHKLFGVFQRLHKESEFEGTGVGLAIVQRIVKKHGGKVWAEGKPGQGASFSFSLPLH